MKIYMDLDKIMPILEVYECATTTVCENCISFGRRGLSFEPVSVNQASQIKWWIGRDNRPQHLKIEIDGVISGLLHFMSED